MKFMLYNIFLTVKKVSVYVCYLRGIIMRKHYKCYKIPVVQNEVMLVNCFFIQCCTVASDL
jgi:hypothetical protein